MIKKHSDDYFIKGFERYILIDPILDSDNWMALESKLKKNFEKEYTEITERLFNEFKFYNCVLKIEYAITDTLNDFLIKENKITDLIGLKNKFIKKIERNEKISGGEARKLIEGQIKGETARILTPHIMLYCVGFGVGELIDYIRSSTKNFFQKKKLIASLTKFNECRKLAIHNLATSREDVGLKIIEGIVFGKEIIGLIDGITSTRSTIFSR